MWTNLSRWDEVALRGASERQLLLGNHHHLGGGRIDMSGSDRSWATTRLYPWSTGGHGWSVLIVTLANRWGEGRRGDEGQVTAQANLLLCTFSVSAIEVLAHVYECCCVCGVCVQSQTLLTSAGSNALTATANMYNESCSWITPSLTCTECHVMPLLHWG